MTAILGGNTAILANAVYALVGAAAVYQAASIKGIWVRWNVRPKAAPAVA